MKLDAFRFRHVGPFGADGVEVSGLQPGLNVLAEHNERGKSSLLAALETVLFLPHTSWKGDAKRLAREDGAPMGEVDFTHEGRRYRLQKRFVKSRHAELIDLTTGETLALKREAEEKLGAMLGFDAGSNGPSGLLWVRQGDSMQRASDDGQVASRLESELSTLVGGDRARAYLDRTEAELGELLTPKGRVKTGGPLSLAEDALASAEAQLDTARQARDATRRLSEDLARVETRIQALEAQGDSQAETKELNEARDALDRARLAKSQRDAQQDRLRRLDLELESATNKLTAHMESVAALDRAQEARGKLRERRGFIAKQDTETKARIRDLRDKVAELDNQRSARAQREQQRALQDRLALRQSALQAVTANLDALSQEQRKRESAVAERDALALVTDADLTQINRLIREGERLAAELATVDAALIIDLKPGIRATLGDQTVTNGPIRLSATDALKLDGIGSIRLDAPEAQSIRNHQTTVQDQLDADYVRLGISGPEEGVRLMRERQALSDDITLIDKQIALIAPDGEDALIDAKRHLSDEIQTLSDQGRDTLDDTDLQDAVEIETALATLKGELAALQTQADALTVERARIDAQLSTFRREIDSAPLEARAETRDAAQASLSAKTATLTTQMDSARAALDAMQSQAPADPALIEARIKRLTAARTNRAKTLSDLRMEAAELNARRRESFEQRDPEAEVRRLEDRIETLSDDVYRHRHRARALTLLRETLQDAQRALQDQYTEPVRRELLPLLRQVIDGADVALDETLGAQGLTRDGTDDALERLSGGTREQIAVLTRLAFARLLARGGQPSPVILDDALVYADDARRGRMFDVLNYVTSGDDPLQLLYLSCHETSTLELGGHRLHLDLWPEN